MESGGTGFGFFVARRVALLLEREARRVGAGEPGRPTLRG